MSGRDTSYSLDESERYDSHRFDSRFGKAIHEREFELLQAGLEEVPQGGRIAEFGCGTGRLLVPALTRFGTLTGVGIDSSSYMLTQLRGREGFDGVASRIELTQSSAEATELGDSSVDFAFAIRLLNQVASVEVAREVIIEMWRVTKPGGVILCEFKNAARPGAVLHRRASTLLRSSDIMRTLPPHDHLWTAGAFFFGMTGYHRAPLGALGVVDRLDRSFSKRLPTKCSRVYVAARKRTS